ncbi:MAG TPA: MFS transporter [Acidisoma sp.]|uniref:MFS transporter n=1 Tax=Acidisoma sp. TaxID=1872115 RepID=UPI002B85F2D0|nr:MFS transporter [Acidisoma sp.]HTI00155.1 MFS transporter [Acidisoma sp.]
MPTDTALAPALPRVPRARLIVAAMLISTFMAAVEVTVISTAMPTIVATLGGFRLFSWAFGIYLLAQAVMTPLYGRLADTFGRKSVYLGGTALFLAGSLLCGLAWSMPALILFRAIQGIGGGSLAPLATTILGDISAPEDRPKLIGYVSGIWGIAAVVGPLLGAFFVHTLGWEFCFWVNLPVGLVTMTMVWRFLQEDPRLRAFAPIDLAGCLLLIAGLGTMMAALVGFDRLSTSGLIGWLALAALLLGGFAWRERRVPHPLLPLHLVLRPLLLVANGSALLAGALLIAVTAFLPPLVQGVLGGSALASGILLGVLTVAWTAASMTIGRAVGRGQDRMLAAASAFLILLGMAALVPIAAARSLPGLDLIAIPIGAGMGLLSIVFTVAAQSGVAARERGRSTALFYFSRLMGQALGAAAFGGVLNAGLGDTHGHDLMRELVDPVLRAGLAAPDLATASARLGGALHGVFLVAAVIAAVTLIVVLLTPRVGTARR